MSPWMHARRRSVIYVELFLNISFRAYNCKIKMSITFDAMRKTRKTYTIKTIKYINKIIHYFFGGENDSILLDGKSKVIHNRSETFLVIWKSARLIEIFIEWFIIRRARIYAHKSCCVRVYLVIVLNESARATARTRAWWFNCLEAKLSSELCQLSFDFATKRARKVCNKKLSREN